MAKEIFNRYEKKYLLNYDQYIAITKIVAEHMIKDQYNKDDKKYLISNIYYDTCDDHLIRTSLQKPKYKEKIRIRSYGPTSDDEFVYLEIKKKYNKLVNKRRTKLTLKEAKDLIEFNDIELKDYMNPQVVKEIKHFLTLYKVIPKVYLSYERLAFFAKDDDDLRLTIDTNIRSDRSQLSLNVANSGDTLLDEGKFLMEIKSSKAMPIWLVRALSENKIYSNSFSKYGKDYKNYLESHEKNVRTAKYSVDMDNLKGERYGFTY